MAGVSSTLPGGQWWGVRWKGDKEKLDIYLDRIAEAVGPGTKFYNTIAEIVIGFILKRTEAGVDVNGQRFKPYSPQYAKFKSTIRSWQNVDLKLWGDMLKSMRFEVSRYGQSTMIRVFFTGVNKQGTPNSVVAWVHDTGGSSGRRGGRFKMPQRHFFGINQREEKGVRDKLQKLIMDEVMKAQQGLY